MHTQIKRLCTSVLRPMSSSGSVQSPGWPYIGTERLSSLSVGSFCLSPGPIAALVSVGIMDPLGPWRPLLPLLGLPLSHLHSSNICLCIHVLVLVLALCSILCVTRNSFGVMDLTRCCLGLLNRQGKVSCRVDPRLHLHLFTMFPPGLPFHSLGVAQLDLGLSHVTIFGCYLSGLCGVITIAYWYPGKILSLLSIRITCTLLGLAASHVFIPISTSILGVTLYVRFSLFLNSS